MVKLHEWQARYERKHEEHGTRRISKALSKTPSPVDVTNELLNDHWFSEGKKLQKRAAKLKESCDRLVFQRKIQFKFEPDSKLFQFPIEIDFDNTRGHGQLFSRTSPCSWPR